MSSSSNSPMNSMSSASLGSSSTGGTSASAPMGNPGFTNQGNIPFSSLESVDTTDFQGKKKHDKLKWVAIAGSVVIGGVALYISKGKIAEAWKKISNKTDKTPSNASKEAINTKASHSASTHVLEEPKWFNDLKSNTSWSDVKNNSHFDSTSKENLYQSIINRCEDDHINSLRAFGKKKPDAEPAKTFEKKVLTDMLKDSEMQDYRQNIAEASLFAKLPDDIHSHICESKLIDLNHFEPIHDVDMSLFHRLMERKKYQAAEIVAQQPGFNRSLESDGKDFQDLLKHYKDTMPANTVPCMKLHFAKQEYESALEKYNGHKTPENYKKERQAWARYQEYSSDDTLERLASLLNTINY